MNQKTHLPFALFIAFAILLTACEKFVQERKAYYSNGVVKEITTYRDSVKDGKYVSFYEIGNVKEKGFYKLGQKDGAWKEWYCSGQLKDVQYYKAQIKPTTGLAVMGKMSFEEWKWTRRGSEKELPEGIWKEWYDNGLLKMIRIYKFGSAKFVWVKWNENGKIKGMGYDFYL